MVAKAATCLSTVPTPPSTPPNATARTWSRRPRRPISSPRRPLPSLSLRKGLASNAHLPIANRPIGFAAPLRLDRRSMKQLSSLSVFFPCYNEEANVEKTTLAALRTCRRISNDLEVIIVNDGSRDRTGEIADRLAAEHHEVRVVHNNPNQ